MAQPACAFRSRCRSRADRPKELFPAPWRGRPVRPRHAAFTASRIVPEKPSSGPSFRALRPAGRSTWPEHGASIVRALGHATSGRPQAPAPRPRPPGSHSPRKKKKKKKKSQKKQRKHTGGAAASQVGAVAPLAGLPAELVQQNVRPGSGEDQVQRGERPKPKSVAEQARQLRPALWRAAASPRALPP